MQLARLAESYLQPSDAFDCRRLTKQWWSSWCFCWLFLRIQICPKKGTFPYNPILGMGSWILLFGGVWILWLWHKGFVQLQKLLKIFFRQLKSSRDMHLLKNQRQETIAFTKETYNCSWLMTLLILLTSMKCCMILGKSERPQPRSPQMMFWKGNPPKDPLIQVFGLYYFTQMIWSNVQPKIISSDGPATVICSVCQLQKEKAGPAPSSRVNWLFPISFREYNWYTIQQTNTAMEHQCLIGDTSSNGLFFYCHVSFPEFIFLISMIRKNMRGTRRCLPVTWG